MSSTDFSTAMVPVARNGISIFSGVSSGVW